MRSNSFKNLLLILPVLSFWYVGLFLTILFWYPSGLSEFEWKAHVIQFSVVFVMWFIIFFVYSLFDLKVIHNIRTMLTRLFGATFFCVIAAIIYFYFQPELLLTPRRFLLVLTFISSMGIFLWYWILHLISPKVGKNIVYSYYDSAENKDLKELISLHGYTGLIYGGVFSENNVVNTNDSPATLILPPKTNLDSATKQKLFALRSTGVRFLDYYDLHENLTRTVHLSALSELWFIESFDYGSHQLFDLAKRFIDILLSLVAVVVFILTFPLFGILIKLTSKGPVLFKQKRVGLFGVPFVVYKYRTMTSDSASNAWAGSGQKVTLLGRVLRATRIDELPQSINILKGDMSIVGPRPEQVGIVDKMREQIPYYDERHIVKPGLTGWAQLHVYAASVEETKQKLQYDLYYIKHRSLLFDLEIILKTVYNILNFKGQ